MDQQSLVPSSCHEIQQQGVIDTSCMLLHRCVVTKSSYTEEEDFTKADAVYDCIGDEGDERFTYAELAKSLLQGSAV